MNEGTSDPSPSPAGTPAEQDRARRRRARMLGLVAASCAVDVPLLLAFAYAGVTDYSVGLRYGALCALALGLFYLALRSGWSERFADPALTREQIFVSAGIELYFASQHPQLAFYFLNLLFVIFSFGALRLRLRQAVLYWLVIGAVAGAVTHHLGRSLDIPGATALEELLVSLCYASSLLRCTFVGLYGSRVRALLHERNRELAAMSAQLARLASHDALTGALTRRPIWTLLEAQARRTAAQQPGFCVAMLDIDRFKSINDRHGHAAGDEVLRRFADAVRAQLRPSDALGRYGGEEFLLLLDAVDAAGGLAVVERIRRAVAALRWNELAPELHVTVSGGVAAYAAGEPLAALIRRADEALYEAKGAGRDRVVLVHRDGRRESPPG